MPTLNALPIRTKLVVIGIVTALAALVLTSAVFLVSTYVLIRRAVHGDLEAQASIVAENTTAALAFADRTAATETLHALRAKAAIDVACLYDHESELFARYAAAGGATCPTFEPPMQDEIDRRGATIVRPIVLDGRAIGTLYLHATLSDVVSHVELQAAAAVGGLAIGAVVAFLIAGRLQRMISVPIQHLAETSAEVSSSGDYSRRAAKTTDDEIGALVDAFNAMLSRVQGRDAELSATNRELSQEIEERQRVESERTTLLARERDANRLKDEFLAALSHELRTPLNAILGWTQILQLSDAEPKLARALASIDRNARAQARMIEDLLDVSRIVSGKFYLKTDVVDLNVVVDAALDVVRPAASARQLTLACSLLDEPALVAGDQDRLQQVLWNLLSNAVKFTPTEGAVSVTVEKERDVIVVSVADTGIGIPVDFLPHVFDRFRQADGSMAREHGGLGLGLAIVHDVVELHGGSVAVESGGRGRGATFSVHLPRLPLAAVATHGHPSAAARLRLDGVTALVVDDDPDSRELAGATLGAAGARVETAESADEALALLERRRYSVLVCDIGMPDVDGYAMLRQIRSREAAAGLGVAGDAGSPGGPGNHMTPAVAMTAYASQEDVARALVNGYQAHVAKPYNMATLINAVASVTAGRRTS